MNNLPLTYILSEYVQNCELQTYIYSTAYPGGKMPLTEDICRNLFRQIIEGLQHVHSMGFAHRDIKTHNIILGTNFEPKIIDFGLSN